MAAQLGQVNTDTIFGRMNIPNARKHIFNIFGGSSKLDCQNHLQIFLKKPNSIFIPPLTSQIAGQDGVEILGIDDIKRIHESSKTTPKPRVVTEETWVEQKWVPFSIDIDYQFLG